MFAICTYMYIYMQTGGWKIQVNVYKLLLKVNCYSQFIEVVQLGQKSREKKNLFSVAELCSLMAQGHWRKQMLPVNF